MAKNKTVFVCSSCGYESPKWLGKCPACNEWNTFYEKKVVSSSKGSVGKSKENAKPIELNKIEGKTDLKISTGFNELDRVLGGGLVNGSLILLGGEPGIGKSTLILQICDKIKTDGKILYISGEESGEQIKLRADRLGVKKDNLLFLSETNIENIESRIELALRKVGMYEYINKDTFELSLGQKQRIAIAGILALDTKIIVLDEPTTMLDPEGKKAIYEIVKSLNKQGYTVIYITNVIDEILLADRIIMLKQGNIENEFNKNDILQNIDILRSLNMEVPIIIQILEKLKEKSIDIDLKEFTINELVQKIVDFKGE